MSTGAFLKRRKVASCCSAGEPRGYLRLRTPVWGRRPRTPARLAWRCPRCGPERVDDMEVGQRQQFVSRGKAKVAGANQEAGTDLLAKLLTDDADCTRTLRPVTHHWKVTGPSMPRMASSCPLLGVEV